MYDAYEKRESLKTVMRLIERAKDELAGMNFIGVENDLDDLMQDVYDEISDLDDEIEEANREQEEADEREYYAACY